jgi:hypothetical protein
MGSEGARDNPKFDRFESLAEFWQACKDKGIHPSDNARWCGESRAEIVDRIENGHTGAVPKAEKILDDIDNEIDMAGIRNVWGRSVVGPFPDVPAFLSNEPMCMYQKQPQEDKRSEINVYYSPVGSASIPHEELFKRGVAVLAAVMALSRVRPVNVHLLTVYGKGDHIIKLRTNPMILSEAAYALTSQGIMRGLSFEYAKQLYEWKGRWGRWTMKEEWSKNEDEKIAHMRKVLNLTEDDILISAVHSQEAEKIFANPVAWINRLLDKYRNN